jgi:hypothetical protein
MRDIVIGSITNYDFNAIRPWVNSLDRCGFAGEKIMLCYNIDTATKDQLRARGYTVIYSTEAVSSIVVDRFLDYWQILKDIDDCRYVIATDVKDVVFQRNPVEWLEKNLQDKKINASSESIRYQDETWGNLNLLTAFGKEVYNKNKDRIINNAGVMSGDAKTLCDLFLNVYLVSKGSAIRNPDQAAYNVLLNMESYKNITRFTQSEEAWAAQLGTTKDPVRLSEYSASVLEPEPQMIDDKVYTAAGEEFYIVHQYDRVKDWKNTIERTYDD